MDGERESADGPASARVAMRSGVALSANLVRTALSFAGGMFVARGFGASAYGDLHFLLGSFAAVRQLLDMGTSSAFYTFIARRRRSRTFFAYYLGWLACQFLGTVAVVTLVLPNGLVDRIWLGHDRAIVLLAFIASFLMNEAWGMVTGLGEARRKTVIVQTGAVAQTLAHLVLVVSAVWWGWLSLGAVLWLLVAEYGLLVIALGPHLLRSNVVAESRGGERATTILGEIATYCKPLVVFYWVGFLYAFADRWFLQQFGLAEQQGFFAVGQQVAGVSLVVTTSTVNIFWKEIAAAREGNDLQRLQYLYWSFTRRLYFIGAWTSCLVIPYGREILVRTVGLGYESAWLPLALLCVSSIHQSLGQIGVTYLYATGDTRSYSRISLVMMGVSIPITYAMLASPSAVVPGLGLGAAGLAAKVMVLQIVGVNVLGYVIARANGWRHEYSYQVVVIGSLLAVGWIGKRASMALVELAGAGAASLGMIVVGAVVYAGLSLAMVGAFPVLAGLSRPEMMRVLTAGARWVRPRTLMSKASPRA